MKKFAVLRLKIRAWSTPTWLSLTAISSALTQRECPASMYTPDSLRNARVWLRNEP
jgi:hypothetical protein